MNRSATYHRLIDRPVRIAPLVTFRILFGGLMAFGAIRFMWYGWIERLYVKPKLFFKFYGFEWVEPFGQLGMYLLYSAIALSALMIMVGLFYRLAAIVFFLTFTYSELIDVTNYLNHYYLVILLSLLLIFLPANRRFSLDVWRKPQLSVTHVPAWVINLLILQVGIVYFFAGLAKINPDWLFRAMPLAVWLPANADLPLIGWLFNYSWIAFAFSWFGAFYDLTIPFWLSMRATRPFAYAAVIVFHGLTKVLFNIGLFPYIMIFNTLIFFPARIHEKWLGKIGYTKGAEEKQWRMNSPGLKILRPALVGYLALQLLLPLRSALYPGNVLWSEEGYRFAWRVMLVEKVGQATFYVFDPDTGRKSEVINSDHLTKFQEKQMSIQPDLILQYAHYLEDFYQQKYNIRDPEVTVDSHVSLNGRASRQLIAPMVDLTEKHNSWRKKEWILAYK